MDHAHVGDLEQTELKGGPCDRRDVSGAIGATDFVLRYYELAPGEGFSGGFHTHTDQEEAFYVLEGTATFDTEDGEAAVTVGAGEAVRFAPGEFQHGYNDSGDRVRALAFGAPPGMDGTVGCFVCAACGEEAKHDVNHHPDAGVHTSECRECGNTVETDAEYD